HPAGRSRAEQAAVRVADLAAEARPGTRLGTKEEMRQRCGVSVGTFNDALRLLQTRELITVRPGPGGGLFVADRTPTVRLGNSLPGYIGERYRLHADLVAALERRDAAEADRLIAVHNTQA